MPQVILNTTQKSHALLSDKAFEEVAKAMAQAVAKVLGIHVDSVAVTEQVSAREYNSSQLQIWCIASSSPERLEKLPHLKQAMREVLVELDKGNGDCAKYLRLIGEAEVWPMMPAASWRSVLFTTD